MLKLPSYMVAGFALFAMFFGASNLLYPIGLGATTSDTSVWFAALGFFFTGVLLPFLGVIGIIIYDGNDKEYYKTIDSKILYALMLMIILLIGPLGATPRCIVVAHAAIELLSPNTISLWVFSIAYCLLTIVLIYKTDNVIEIIGKILTPILLAGIAVTLITGLFTEESQSIAVMRNMSIFDSLSEGLSIGYQTMDLLASVLYGVTVVSYMSLFAKKSNYETRLRDNLKACFVGASCHTSVYFSLMYMGHKFSDVVGDVRADQRVLTLGEYLLNSSIAKPLIATVIILACLTTSTALTVICSDFCQNHLKKIGIQKKILSTVCVLFGVFLTSLYGFDTITMIIVKTLILLYPAIISLAIGRILDKLFNWNIGHIFFYCSSLLAIILYIYKHIIC